jgi:hypothetical protein
MSTPSAQAAARLVTAATGYVTAAWHPDSSRPGTASAA